MKNILLDSPWFNDDSGYEAPPLEEYLDYDERKCHEINQCYIIEQFAEYTRRFPKLTLAKGSFMFEQNRKRFFKAMEFDEKEIEKNRLVDVFTMKTLGLAGEGSYIDLQANMKIKDYMMLVPSNLLPKNYQY